MTKLECEVKSCGHNMDRCCCISSICVDGDRAVNEAETCCDDFIEKKDSASNSIDKEKNPVVDVLCRAENCIYNDEARCQAEDICICGYSASNCSDTRCGSFTMH